MSLDDNLVPEVPDLVKRIETLEKSKISFVEVVAQLKYCDKRINELEKGQNAAGYGSGTGDSGNTKKKLNAMEEVLDQLQKRVSDVE